MSDQVRDERPPHEQAGGRSGILEIYSAHACPFAHRTRALLTHLRVPFKLHEIDLDDRDPHFLKLSPTGRVPLLVDGDFTLYESQVINEYLTDVHDWGRAFATDSRLRARQRLAMKQWDSVVLPAFYASLRDPATLDAKQRDTVGRELDELARTTEQMGPEVHGLLAFHVGTHWARMAWLRSYTGLPELVDDRPALRKWLDRAAASPALLETLPDRKATVRRYEKRYVGRRAAA